jgi:nucleotide-binding universal stress UspA family protein
MPGAFVVGIGGGGSGFEAARAAARIASATGAPLVLVFGYESSPRAPSGGPMEERVAVIGEEAIGQIRAEINAAYPDLIVEMEIVAQRPADALINVAEQRSAEMIAVGHGGQGPFRAALLGSVTYEMVHRCVRPVLVVPDDEDEVITPTGRGT